MVKLFRLQLGRSEEEERLRCVGNFANAGWKQWHSGNGLWGSGNGLWLANGSSARKVIVVCLRMFYKVKGGRLEHFYL